MSRAHTSYTYFVCTRNTYEPHMPSMQDIMLDKLARLSACIELIQSKKLLICELSSLSAGDVATWSGVVTGALMLLSPLLFDRWGWRGVANATPNIFLFGGSAFFITCIVYQHFFGAAVAAGGATAAGATGFLMLRVSYPQLSARQACTQKHQHLDFI